MEIHCFSGVHIDRCLTSAKRTFLREHTQEWKQFPSTRRALFDQIKKVPVFWPEVMHAETISLSQFNLASGTANVSFEFINPLWGWLMAARRQHPLDMHWKPFAQCRDRPVYGGGVEYGECFRAACRSCPRGSYPMCVHLHWDGAVGRGMSAAPICIGVGNTNICGSDTQFCVGYMPHIPDSSRPEFRKTQKFTTIKHYVRQRCAAAILRVLEAGARTGVRCRLKNIKDTEVERVLFPRLTAMNFDQPEAQLFFGMQNKSSCSKCKWRKGYSAFRRGTPLRGTAVRRLYLICEQGLAEHRKCAQEKLRRWGFNYKRKCCLFEVCDRLLVRLPGKDEVYPCLDFRDSLHALMMYYHRAVMDIFNYITLSPEQKRLLDRRLAVVCELRCFRDPAGLAYRRQKSVFKEVGMTAVDKVCMLFLLPHVLGPTADVIPDTRMRAPLLTAIAHAQLMNIASRGLRSYNEQELRVIFDRGNIVFHGALAKIRELEYCQRVHAHEQDSDSDAPPPKRFKKTDRLTAIVHICCGLRY